MFYNKFLVSIGDESYIDLGGEMYVPVSAFQSFFGDIVDYIQLVSIDAENGYGYKHFFDKCKEEGLIE